MASSGKPGRMKKLNFDSLFDWLDEEKVTKPKPKSRKREPTSVPPAVSGKNTRDGSESTSRSKSVAVAPNEVGVKIATTKTSKQHKLFSDFEKAFPSKKIHKSHVVQRQKATAKTKSSDNDEVEECLANASNSHFLQLAAGEVPKKKRNTGRVKTRTNKELQVWLNQLSEPDKALDAARVKGKCLQEKRRQLQRQQSTLQKQKRIEMMVRCTPLNGSSKWSFDLLPDEPLKHVASYLTSLSRVLFDIALSGDVLSSIDGNSRGVAGDHWDTLDFGEIEISLAKKLRDRHLKAILLRIDAVNNLKRLTLTNCVKITGVGLEPLRGSIVIEQIDLSILNMYWRGWGAYAYLPTPQIVVSDHVEPILDSIIAREGSALKHLQFPMVSKPSNEFYNRYNDMLRLRNHRRNCFKCNRISRPVLGLSRPHDDGTVQYNTCYGCLNHFCGLCRNEEHMLNASLCHGCGRYYCLDCKTITRCNCCNKCFCTTCEENFTDCCISTCDRKICSDCTSKQTCEMCKRSWCQLCSSGRNIELWDVGMNSKRLHCTSCLSCAVCGGHADPDYWCKYCSDYFCGRCFRDKETQEHDEDYYEYTDMCAACKEDGQGYRQRRRETHIVYGDAFTSAPICDM